MKSHFVEAVQQAVQNSGYSNRYLAAELDKRPSSLYNELNPFAWDGCTAKLGLEDAIRIMEIIEDHTPLELISSHFNCSLRDRSRNHQQNDKNFDAECLESYQALSSFIKAAQEDASSYELVRLYNEVLAETEDIVNRKRQKEQNFKLAK